MTKILMEFVLLYFTMLYGQLLVQAEPPSWESDWVEVISGTSDNYHEIQHGLGEVPLKVKVLVKPTTGPNAGLVFEATSQQEADNDDSVTYCGVLYFYDEQKIYLYVAHSTTAPGGRLFCTGVGWSDGFTDHNQVSNTGRIKAMVWTHRSFPVPTFTSAWTYIDATNNFHELQYTSERRFSYVHLQARGTKTDSTVIYGEGTSRGPGTKSSLSNHGGVLYAYSDNTIRVWNNREHTSVSVLAATDGYGSSTHKFKIPSGEFRVYGWSNLGSTSFEFSMDMNNDTISGQLADISQIALQPTPANKSAFHIVKVTALAGANAGFTFTSVGQIQLTPNGVNYGGLAFGYNETLMRIFVPTGSQGSIVAVAENWGDNSYAGFEKNVRIDVAIWNIIPETLTLSGSKIVGHHAE